MTACAEKCINSLRFKNQCAMSNAFLNKGKENRNKMRALIIDTDVYGLAKYSRLK